MRTPTVPAGAAVAVLLASACQAPGAEFTDQDQATLRAMFDSVASEIGSARWDTWAAHYTEDAILQPPNAPTVTGRAAILAWGKVFPPVETVAFGDVRVSGEGNMALGTSAYTLKLKDLPPDSGKQLVVFRRLAGGGWAVQAVSFSSNLPPAGPPPAPAAPAR